MKRVYRYTYWASNTDCYDRFFANPYWTTLSWEEFKKEYFTPQPQSTAEYRLVLLATEEKEFPVGPFKEIEAIQLELKNKMEKTKNSSWFAKIFT